MVQGLLTLMFAESKFMTRVTKAEFHKHFSPLGGTEPYTVSLPASEFHSLMLVAPRIHFMLSLTAALSQLFPLPVHLSHPGETDYSEMPLEWRCC